MRSGRKVKTRETQRRRKRLEPKKITTEVMIKHRKLTADEICLQMASDMRRLTADKQKVDGDEWAMEIAPLHTAKHLVGTVYRGFGYLWLLDRVEDQSQDFRWDVTEPEHVKEILIWRQNLTPLELMEVSIEDDD